MRRPSLGGGAAARPRWARLAAASALCLAAWHLFPRGRPARAAAAAPRQRVGVGEAFTASAASSPYAARSEGPPAFTWAEDWDPEGLAAAAVRSGLVPRATVIVTSYSVEGFRPTWLRRILEYYAAPAQADLVDRVLLVWNNPEADPPAVPGVVVLRAGNSLNNRWNRTAPHVRTDAVLNVDDDILVTKAGLACLLQRWAAAPGRLVGPVARRHAGREYQHKEIGWTNRAAYSILLPRAMVLHRRYLDAYAADLPAALKRYVDDQAAHCDDILLNAMVANITRRPPLRVIPPEGSVVDFFERCFVDRPDQTGGLALEDDRGALRNECLAHILDAFGDRPGREALRYSDEVVMCLPDGRTCSTCRYAAAKAFLKMRAAITC